MSGRHRREDEQVEPGMTPDLAVPSAPTAEAPVEPSPPEPPASANGARVGRRRAPGAPDTGPLPTVRDGEPAPGYTGGRRRRAGSEVPPASATPAPGTPAAPAPTAPAPTAPAPAARTAPAPAATPTAPMPAARRDPAQAPVPGLAPREAPATRPQQSVAHATATRTPTLPRPEPRTAEPRTAEPRPTEPRPTEPRPTERAARHHELVEAPSAAAATTVMTSARRAEQRERERRAERRKKMLLVGGLAAVLLLVVGAVVWKVFLSGGSGHATSDTSKQQTMLLQLTGADKKAVGSALIGVTGPTADAAVVLVPSRLVVDAPGAGSMPFGQVASLADRTTSQKALTDLTGVDVGSTFALDPAALAALVDKLGGIDVDVDADVTSKAANGATTVVVAAGQQHLTGAQANAYAAFTTGAGEPDAARLSRFNDVLRGVLTKLPKTPSEVQPLLAGLDNASGQPVGTAAGILATLAAVEDAGSVAYDTLPVRDIDTGTSVITYGLDATAADALVKSRFPGSLVGGGSDALRVLVENGVGTPGLADKARSKLVGAGMRFVNGGNATQFGFTSTVVLIPDASSANRAKGERVAKALHVPVQDVQTSPRGQTVADVIVILGKDFTP